MGTHRPRGRRWRAGLIIGLFFCAVGASAGVGWWYARESPPHQGPIVVITVDGMPASALPAAGAPQNDASAVEALLAEAVVFERAYSHSPHTLPAHASLLSGRLPVDHGVRDDAGFALGDEIRTMAELLRSRGFATGAAVSSFLLRRESGLAQGFTYFDGDLPLPDRPDPAAPSPADPPVLERDGALTVAAAERWMRRQESRRFFLLVEVNGSDADTAVARLTAALKEQGLYDGATIVFVGSRGDTGSGLSLDEDALRIPFVVRQPGAGGAGRHIAAPVQHVDLLPTLLDLVRAPLPAGLRGRSLRAILDDDEGDVEARPIYAESLTALYRFGGTPLYAMSNNRFRYLRGVNEELVPLAGARDGEEGGASADAGRLRTALDRLLESGSREARVPVTPADEERLALVGHLGGLRLPAGRGADPGLSADEQRALVASHRAAALLVGQKSYSAGIRTLQAIVRRHPSLTAVHYQLGVLLSRTGRFEESIGAFGAARALEPALPTLALAMAEAQVKAGRLDAAWESATEGVALAGTDGAGRAAAHAVAARVALARKDAAAATAHAEAAHAAESGLPLPQFVSGRLHYDEGRYDEALAAFRQADAALREGGGTMPDLHLYLGETLAHLEQHMDAEAQFREELLAFPRNTQAYASLAMLYRAANRDDAVEDVLNELVAATPTPEGYALAARLWTALGDRSRAEALRTDARTRFQGDPSLALLGRDARR